MKNQNIRRRLFFDIETTPHVGSFYQLGDDQRINFVDIITPSRIICICWRWEEEKTIYSLSWDRHKSDKAMLKAFLPILHQADEVIAHNGDNFDIKWLRTQAILYGLTMMPRITTIDTLKEARSRFRFPSNALDNIAGYLGLTRKTKNLDKKEIHQLLETGDKKLLKRCIEYCKNDVLVLQQVFNKLNPYIPAKTNFAALATLCPECGSQHTVVNKHRVTAAGAKQTTFQCKDCGKYHTIATSKLLKVKRGK